MTRLTAESLTALHQIKSPACLSLYQPTHRAWPDSQQNIIVFKNLVKALETSLRQRYSEEQTQQWLAPFEALARDREFWFHTLDGLAVLGAPGHFQVFRLQRPVPELAIVADTFHTKPLRRLLQSVDRYQVLGLTLSKVALYEGNRDALDEVELADEVPKTLEEALGEDITDPRHSVSAYGGARGHGRGMANAMHHGHGGRKDEVNLDAERFFRVVDRKVHEYHSKPSGLPLILAALTEHHSLFHKVSRNPFLLPTGLHGNPQALSTEALRRRVWECVEPGYLERQKALADAFSDAKAHQMGSDELPKVAEAAACGRVSVLMIESGRQLPGRLDRETGKLRAGALNDPEVDDLLDDLGDLVETMGGEVKVIPPERMPAPSGLAAIYRH